MADQVVSQVVGKVKGDISDLKTKYADAKKETTGLSGFMKSSMQNIASTALGFLTGSAIQQGIGFLVGGFKDLITTGINYNATLEQTQTAFTQLLGSKNAAQQFVTMLQQFSDTTPFEAQPIYDAAQELLAFGYNAQQVKPYLTAIGDALSDMGHADSASLEGVVTIFGQIKASANAQTQDLKQFTSYGINAFQILANMMTPTKEQVQELVKQGLEPASAAMDLLGGKTKLTQSDVQALVTAGLIPGAQAADLLQQGLEKTYGGGMAAQAKTFNGLVSTLKTHLEQAVGTLTGPLFNEAEQGLSSIVGWMSSPAVTNFIKQVGTDLANGFKNAGNFLQTLKKDFLDAFDDKNGDKVKKLKDLAKELGDKLKDLGDWIKQHGKQALEDLAKAAGDVTSWLSNLKQTVKDVKSWFDQWGPTIEYVGYVLTVFFLPAIIKSGVESAIAGGKIAANFVMSIINAGKEAIVSAGKLWLNAGSFVYGMLETGNTAETSAAKVDAMAAAETAVGEKAEASAALEGMAAAEDAVGASAEGATAKIGAMTAAEEGAGEAATAATGTAGAGAAAGAAGGASGVGILGFIAAMAGLAYAMDQSDHAAANWARDLHNWLTGVQNDYFGLSAAEQETTDNGNTLGGMFNGINDFFKNTPFLANMDDLRNQLLNIADAESSAAQQAQFLDQQWAQTHVPNLGQISNDNPTLQNGHPHALGGMVGPSEMLSLLNDQGGYGELARLPSGTTVYTHQQSVTMLQQQAQPSVHNAYDQRIILQGPTSDQMMQQLRASQAQRKALVFGGRR